MSGLSKVDGMIGNPAFAINLVAQPPEETKALLSDVQERIAHSLPRNAMFECPVSSLHLSVFQFVHSRNAKLNNDTQVWECVSKSLLSHIDSAINEAMVCNLHGSSLHVSESAIFLRFSESREIESLRSRLAGIASQTELNWNRPGIQHVSMFRYLKPIQLDRVRLAIDSIKIPPIEWEITKLQLVRENLYPSLNFTEIQNNTLG